MTTIRSREFVRPQYKPGVADEVLLSVHAEGRYSAYSHGVLLSVHAEERSRSGLRLQSEPADAHTRAFVRRSVHCSYVSVKPRAGAARGLSASSRRRCCCTASARRCRRRRFARGLMHTRTLTNMHARTHARARAHRHTLTHAHAHTNTHIHTYKHAHTHAHARTHAHTHTHARAHTHTRTRAHRCAATALQATASSAQRGRLSRSRPSGRR